MLKILFAEDDKDLNLITSSYLKDCGFEVVSVYNGLDALNKYEEESFDLILSDIMMPLCDGFKLASIIRESNQQIPIIFMSARDDKPSKQLGYKTGIDDYITKPFDLDELVLKINAIARRMNINNSSSLTIGNLKMDKEEHTVYINDEELSLTVREFVIGLVMISTKYCNSSLLAFCKTGFKFESYDAINASPLTWVTVL